MESVMVDEAGFTWSYGGVIRGRRDEKRMALMFTGGHFGEGAGTVLDTLEKHGVKGSFYFTGDFIQQEEHLPHIERMITSGHVVGPHGYAHLLYCPWDDRDKTLVTREEFAEDLKKNVLELSKLGVSCESMVWWIPPYEWYNNDISRWSDEEGHRLFNFTPGTLSHADYTEDDAKNYRSNQVIWDSIFKYEEKEPDGFNGFIMLIHIGAGPRRTEKFFDRLDELITELKRRGYSFATVPELLKDTPART
jgi:peptidoglycan/xylan/chitin deacetylase (PgdA/CDA1 family)